MELFPPTSAYRFPVRSTVPRPAPTSVAEEKKKKKKAPRNERSRPDPGVCALCHEPLSPVHSVRRLHRDLCVGYDIGVHAKRKERPPATIPLPPKKRQRPNKPAPRPEYEVAAIDGHQRDPVTGVITFHTHWKEYTTDGVAETWEPYESFVTLGPDGRWDEVNELFSDYLQTHEV